MQKRGRPDREDYVSIGLLSIIPITIWCAYTYQACGTVFDWCALEPIKEWQALMAGALASGAAIFTIINIREQIDQNNQLERHRRQRRVESQKAPLAHVLSRTIDLLGSDIKVLKGALEDMRQETPENEDSFPKFEWNDDMKADFEVIRDVVEFEDSFPEIGLRLSSLVGDLQTYHSRRDKPTLYSTLDNAIISLIANNLFMQTLTNTLFDYCRSKSNSLSTITYYDLEALALSPGIGFDKNRDQALFKELKKWTQSKTS